jgi:FtsP/CotA-like multicopper oxidase with cupredoxin domain
LSSRARTVVIGAAGVAVAVVLFVVLQGGDDNDDGETAPATTTTVEQQAGEDGGSQGGGAGEDKPQEPAVATIVVRDGQPVGGVQELEFAKGERIRFTVESDIAEEVHLHGYDIAKDVSGGGKVSFDVPATFEGVFEVELEQSVVPLAEITVTPG